MFFILLLLYHISNLTPIYVFYTKHISHTHVLRLGFNEMFFFFYLIVSIAFQSNLHNPIFKSYGKRNIILHFQIGIQSCVKLFTLKITYFGK